MSVPFREKLRTVRSEGKVFGRAELTIFVTGRGSATPFKAHHHHRTVAPTLPDARPPPGRPFLGGV
jgi:hypothetical protein